MLCRIFSGIDLLSKATLPALKPYVSVSEPQAYSAGLLASFRAKEILWDGDSYLFCSQECDSGFRSGLGFATLHTFKVTGDVKLDEIKIGFEVSSSYKTFGKSRARYDRLAIATFALPDGRSIKTKGENWALEIIAEEVERMFCKQMDNNPIERSDKSPTH